MIAESALSSLKKLAEEKVQSKEFAAAIKVIELAQEYGVHDMELRGLLSQASALVHTSNSDPASVHLALGAAYQLAEDNVRAVAEYQAALRFGDYTEARIRLSLIRMPGPDYTIWLGRFHSSIKPRVYLEIGVAEGRSLALASAPTFSIGVDPAPNIKWTFDAKTQLIPETSDRFFESDLPAAVLKGRSIDLAFIDGGHLFEQALRDFVNIEKYSSPRSVVLMHDTVPIDEISQSRVRQTGFYSGDVWKAVLCLKCHRPDLDIFTIATPWTGLTVISGLNPDSRVLSEHFTDTVESFMDKPYSGVTRNVDDALNIMPNDWSAVAARLEKRGIPGDYGAAEPDTSAD